jgi:hypothetical protein
MISFTPGRITSRERAPGTHWIGGWVDPQSRSGRRGEENILDATDPSVVQPVASRYNDYAIPAPSVVQPVASRYNDYAIPAPSHHMRNTDIKATVKGVVPGYRLVRLRCCADPCNRSFKLQPCYSVQFKKLWKITVAPNMRDCLAFWLAFPLIWDLYITDNAYCGTDVQSY